MPKEKEHDEQDNHEALPDSTPLPLDVNPSPPMLKMIEQLEGVIMEKNRFGSGGIDLNTLTEAQKDKILDTLSKHENNAKDVYMKRLEVVQDLKTKEINASIVSQKTNRYLVVGGLLAFVLLTLAILFFKDAFLIPWLTFITGLAGGFGIGKSTTQPAQKSNTSILKDLEGEE